MNKIKKYEVKTYYVVQECECGGDIDVVDEYGVRYLSSPAQQDYRCNKCGKVYRLFEPNFPHTEIEKV